MAKRTITLDTKEIEWICDVIKGTEAITGVMPVTTGLLRKLRNNLKTIKVRSAKAKGMSFQKDVAELISDLTGIPLERDGMIESRPSGCNGTDIALRGEAKKAFPFSVECKATENLNLLDSIEQAKSNQQEHTDWLLFHRRKTLKEDVVVMSVDAFVRLFKQSDANKETPIYKQIMRGLDDSSNGRVVNRGSFESYVQDDIDLSRSGFGC